MAEYRPPYFLRRMLILSDPADSIRPFGHYIPRIISLISDISSFFILTAMSLFALFTADVANVRNPLFPSLVLGKNYTLLGCLVHM